MNITAKVIRHSVAARMGIEIATLHVRLPRFILAQLNTHGAIAKNTGSTRARPHSWVRNQVRTDPARPIRWGANQPGMHAGAEIVGEDRAILEALWDEARWNALRLHEAMLNAPTVPHKEIAGRIIEPFMMVDTLLTATDWINFLALRMHDDAQPEIQELAMAIFDALESSLPRVLEAGEWHLPYVEDDEIAEINRIGKEFFADKKVDLKFDVPLPLCMVSAARCARISYAPFDGNSSLEREFERAWSLVGKQPIHASPAEHQATPEYKYLGSDNFVYSEYHGRFNGWIQFRKALVNENSENVTWEELRARRATMRRITE